MNRFFSFAETIPFLASANSEHDFVDQIGAGMRKRHTITRVRRNFVLLAP